MIAPICGPLIGGYITTYYNWRWIFFINVPIGVIGIVLALMLVPNLREAERPRLDLKGWILAGIALVGLIFGFETLGRSGLPLPIALLIVAVGIAATLLYLRHAPRVIRPILDLSLLRVETFRTAVVGGVSLRLALGSMQLFMPLMLQLGYGLTAFASGSISLFAAGGAMASKPFSPIIFRRFGFRSVLLWNSYIGALTFVIFALAITPSTPHIVLVLVIFLNGFSRSVQLTAINVIAYADVEQRRLSASSTLVSVFQQFSVATGVAIGAAILHALTAATDGGASSHLTVYRYGFMICAVMTLGSQYWFRALSEKAGAAVSGHRLQAAVEPDEAPALGVAAADAVLSEGKATQPSGPSASSG
jgi:MFS family permease